MSRLGIYEETLLVWFLLLVVLPLAVVFVVVRDVLTGEAFSETPEGV